jgi:hypothetical protein
MSSGGAVLVVIFAVVGGNAWCLVSGVPDFHSSPSIHAWRGSRGSLRLRRWIMEFGPLEYARAGISSTSSSLLDLAFVTSRWFRLGG